jgi:predicted ArsR family transcriptional regulator
MAALHGIGLLTDVNLIDPPAPAGVNSSRVEVLRRLHEAPGPLSVTDIAEYTALHVNTARFHLDGLVRDGLAERTTEVRDGPGRPRILFTAQGRPPGPRSYGLLAEMLTGLVAALKTPGPAAAKAGRAWGRHLIERPAPSERMNADEAVVRLNRVFDAIGFQPEARKGKGRGVEIALHHCPFREVSERHQDVVCSLHLGLLQGALAELRAPLAAESLEPFVSPNLCVARLQAAQPAP